MSGPSAVPPDTILDRNRDAKRPTKLQGRGYCHIDDSTESPRQKDIAYHVNKAGQNIDRMEDDKRFNWCQ